LLAATLYQGNPDRNQKLWNIISTDIYIYTPYADAAGMLLHINGKFTFGGRVFQQTVGIPMGTNCAPLLADLFLNSHEADCVQGLLKKLARSFNFAT
jgi:hypothetical protein